MSSSGVLNSQLSKKTGFFGLRLWVVIGIGVGVFIVLILFFLSVWLASRNKKSRNAYKKFPSSVSSTVASIPAVSKEIKEVPTAATEGVLLTILDKSAERNAEKVYVHVGFNRRTSSSSSIDGSTGAVVGVEMGKQLRKSRGEIEENNNSRNLQIVKTGIYNDNNTSSDGGYSGSTAGDTPRSSAAPEVVAHLGWGHWYTLRDLEDATQGFSPENVLGEGGYGIVYRGYLPDGTLVAVKSLLNNRGQAEKEFKVEVEAIGRVRHKNLVRLLGYCVEGNYRMLVYEYVDNGNLEQWLHGQASEMNSPAWEARIKIALGTSKALAYLHEALEPKVVHRDIKASNILLDAQWGAKISDFGLAKMLGSDNSHVKTRVMGTFGYVAPEYANTGLLNERSDVYSFGVLLMELITGRDPVDYGRPSGEVNLVDWVKLMVASRRSEEVADERIAVKPSGRAIKRVLLVALRCVDPDPLKRPKMGRVVHMLETDDFPYHHREGSGRELSGIVSKRTDYKQDRMVEELMSGDDHEETSQ